MTLRRGRAIGGPRDGVMIEAGPSWAGFVSVSVDGGARISKIARYPGRYVWEDTSWVWQTGEWRRSRKYQEWTWAPAGSPVLPEPRVSERVSEPVNEPVRPERRRPGRQPPVVDPADLVCPICGGEKRWWRRTCATAECRYESCRRSMRASLSKQQGVVADVQ